MDGYLDLLARAQKQMYSINEQFDNAVSDDDSYLSELRKKRREAEDYRNNLLADVECLQRLAGDKRMIDAYSLLADQQFTEEQRSGLIYAAWAVQDLMFGLSRLSLHSRTNSYLPNHPELSKWSGYKCRKRDSVYMSVAINRCLPAGRVAL